MKKFLTALFFSNLCVGATTSTCGGDTAQMVDSQRRISVERLEEALGEFFSGDGVLFVKQKASIAEAVTSIEMLNEYTLLDQYDVVRATAKEREGGVKGSIMRHTMFRDRNVEIAVVTPDGRELLRLKRPFFWFFSRMEVSSGDTHIGTVRRRLSIHKKYELCRSAGKNADDHVVGTIKSPPWRLWKFPLYDSQGKGIGEVSKKWSGFLKEATTDADTFLVRFPGQWTNMEKALLLAASFAIDFDCFETNASDRASRSGRINT